MEVKVIAAHDFGSSLFLWPVAPSPSAGVSPMILPFSYQHSLEMFAPPVTCFLEPGT